MEVDYNRDDPDAYGAEAGKRKDRPASPHGKEPMALHTQMQMTSILRPFAEHLVELQASVQSLTSGLEQAQTRIDQLDYRHENTVQQANLIRGDVLPLKAHLMKLQNDLAKVDKDRGALEADHTATKGRAEKLEERVSSSVALICDLRKDLDATSARLPPIEQVLGQMVTVRREEDEKKALDKVWEGIKGLQLQSDLFEKEIKSNQAANRSVTDAMEIFKLDSAKQRHDFMCTLQATSDEVQALKEGTDVLRGRVGIHDKELSATLERHVSTEALIDALTKEKDNVQDLALKTSQELSNVKAHIVPFEKTLNDLNAASSAMMKKDKEDSQEAEKRRKSQVTEFRTIADCLSDLDNKMALTKVAMVDLRESQEAEASVLRKAAEGLDHRLNDVQGGLQQSISDVKGIAEQNRDEIRAIQESATGVSGIHRELQGSIQQNADRFHVIQGDLSDVQRTLAAHKEKLTKMEFRVELCDEQFSGLRKGFRDVRVVGTEDALLPEMLPAPGSRPQSSAGRRPQSRCTTPILPTMTSPGVMNATSPCQAWTSPPSPPPSAGA
jgi:chromosome segregation ATPase